MAKFLMLKVLDVQFNRILPWEKNFVSLLFLPEENFYPAQQFRNGCMGGGGQMGISLRLQSRVTKRCRLFGLTNSALVYERMLERKRMREVRAIIWLGTVFIIHCTLYSSVQLHGAQLNFDDTTPHI